MLLLSQSSGIAPGVFQPQWQHAASGPQQKPPALGNVLGFTYLLERNSSCSGGKLSSQDTFLRCLLGKCWQHMPGFSRQSIHPAPMEDQQPLHWNRHAPVWNTEPSWGSDLCNLRVQQLPHIPTDISFGKQPPLKKRSV